MSEIDDYARWLGEGPDDDPPEPVNEDEPTDEDDGADDRDPNDDQLWREESEPLTVEELDRHAHEARAIAYTKMELEDRLHWSRLAWYFESRAMLLRIAQDRRRP